MAFAPILMHVCPKDTIRRLDINSDPEFFSNAPLQNDTDDEDIWATIYDARTSTSPSRFGLTTTTSGRTTPSTVPSLSSFTVFPKVNQRDDLFPIFNLQATSRTPTPIKYDRFDRTSSSPFFNLKGAVRTPTTSSANTTPSLLGLAEWADNETCTHQVHLACSALQVTDPDVSPADNGIQYPDAAGPRNHAGGTVPCTDLLDAGDNGLQFDNPHMHMGLPNAAVPGWDNHNRMNFDNPNVHYSTQHAYSPAFLQLQKESSTIDVAEIVNTSHRSARGRKGIKNAKRDEKKVQPVFYCVILGCGKAVRRNDLVRNHYRQVHQKDHHRFVCAAVCDAGYICIPHPDPQPPQGVKVPSLSNEEIHSAAKICSATVERHPNYVCRICGAAFGDPKMLAQHMDTLHHGE